MPFKSPAKRKSAPNALAAFLGAHMERPATPHMLGYHAKISALHFALLLHRSTGGPGSISAEFSRHAFDGIYHQHKPYHIPFRDVQVDVTFVQLHPVNVNIAIIENPGAVVFLPLSLQFAQVLHFHFYSFGFVEITHSRRIPAFAGMAHRWLPLRDEQSGNVYYGRNLRLVLTGKRPNPAPNNRADNRVFGNTRANNRAANRGAINPVGVLAHRAGRTDGINCHGANYTINCF